MKIKSIYDRFKRVPVIGRLAVGLRNILQANDRGNDDLYSYSRENVESLTIDTDKEFWRIRNVLNYTKTSGTTYSAKQYPAGYHTIELCGQRLQGQRDPKLRFSSLQFDFTGKRVLDIGTNQGGMLLSIRDHVSVGVGLDYNPRMVNAANRIAATLKACNLHFFVFDLENDPLEMILDLVPDGTVDVTFLLSVCMWIENWESLIRFCAGISPVMIFESNGTDAQQDAQEALLRACFSTVRTIAGCSDDDPLQKRRRLFFCEHSHSGA